MTAKTLAEKLALLAKNDLKINKSARLREVLPQIEIALKAGVTKEKIIEQLAEDGLIFTVSYLNITLHRIREKQKPKSIKGINSPHKAISENQVIEPEKSTVIEAEIYGKHDPRSLDLITNNKPDLAALSKKAKQNKGQKQ